MSDFILPDIGEGIVECELVKWLISEGDEIEEDQPVAEVMTDKALVEIPAPNKGRVTKLYYQEGETAKVHSPLFAVEEAGEDAKTPGAEARVTAEKTQDSSTASAEGDDAAEPVSASADTAANDDDESEDFILPDIGEGIVECEVVSWRIAEGDEIEEDQPVVDVMTDKAMVEITAPKAGRVTQLYYRQQENARVHSPLFAFVPREREDVGKPQTPSSAASSTAAASEPSGAQATRKDRAASGSGAYGRIPASPAVRRLVRELGVRLEDVSGSGKDGRVLKEDILAFEKGRGKKAQATESASAARDEKTATTPRHQASAGDAQDEIEVEPIKGMRAVMAKRMVESATTIPHFSYGDEIDVTELLALRGQLKVEAEKQGTRLTLMALIMKAMALAVQEYPILNSRISEDGTEIHYQPHCNIGMAVDSRAGLIVPNIKQVERLSILEIAAEVERLTQAARDGRVSQADLKEGTISISNIGALGGTYAAPIINAPEVAIVALGRTQQLPRFDENGNVVSRSIMTITWSGDHRIIDGGTIARFCNLWKAYLQAPQSMLLKMV
ncbi:dihydrolipoyllysine-residue acetyltransferase [Halomonas sp. GXIMD04776]|uniref:dihydrolipoyllysine-residue acetyltransferase n=1 Tax=Halomonas sp. GXIMD04776 TaxID=3415605 RepID=UPI003CA6EE05